MDSNIKRHEENIMFLRTRKDQLDESILDLQVSLGKYHSDPKAASENGDISTEEETLEQILQQENSAAAVFCLLKSQYTVQAASLALTKDVVGVLATLARVDNENLSSLDKHANAVFRLKEISARVTATLTVGPNAFPKEHGSFIISEFDEMWLKRGQQLLSEYLGLKTMLAVVCKTLEGVKTLERHDNEGNVNSGAGLHALGSFIGRKINGRFLVICLEDLRPYVGGFVADDLQKRLDILKPKLSNGKCPPGFIDFAVNMISLDQRLLSCVTSDGHGLRETLFYNLFSKLQIYTNKAAMLSALPCITDGALSLDGGIIKRNGIFVLGNLEGAPVKFPVTSGVSGLPASNIDIEDKIKMLKLEQVKFGEDIRREQELLEKAKKAKLNAEA